MDKKNSFGAKKELNNDKRFALTYWKIFNISLFGRGMYEVLRIVENWIDSEAKNKWIATVNPEFVMKALKDDDFKTILKETDLNVVDGIGLIWAREVMKKNNWFKVGVEILQGKHKENLVSGADLMPELCKLASKKDYKVFFLGGFGDRAERTAKYFRSQFSDFKSQTDFRCQFSSGEPEFNNKEVLDKINKFKPDILFVAYGMKKQEEWIKNNRYKADFGVAIGVGRSFDYYSGDLKRASKFFKKTGTEWFYSLIKEPKRIKRQVVLPKFIWKVLTR
ncbi:MAG: WecB/TagA/CpsF family glycosyltransferase [Candidatus Shapirobacteria bacterium]|nr:WecB/TagA/CpsF family glycosyltransferase [Candidatus Shapirobacteria bacterium]